MNVQFVCFKLHANHVARDRNCVARDGPFSGVTIPTLSQERRGFKSSIFTVSLLFVTL